MLHTTTIDQTNAEQHRLSIGDLHKLEHLSEDIIFNLSNEEFENMMNQIDSSVCIEPPYFPMSIAEQEPQNLSYF